MVGNKESGRNIEGQNWCERGSAPGVLLSPPFFIVAIEEIAELIGGRGHCSF